MFENVSTMLRCIITLCIICIIMSITYSTVSKEGFFSPDKKKVPGKTVWLLWFDGWDNAPWIARQVRKSWEQLNPEWNIELVDEQNLGEYVTIPYIHMDFLQPAARSDIIRLYLLTEHGGVWADATMLCMIPLDRWVYPALENSGFWMYHGRDWGAGPASWFMISLRNSYIISTWKNACDKFWQSSPPPPRDYDYYWMDALFTNLLESDSQFAYEWSHVPYLWCEATGQAHMLNGKCQDNTPELKHILEYNPPYAVKLTRHGLEFNNLEETSEDIKDSNVVAAISYALEQKHAPYPLHTMETVPNPLTFAASVMITADCNMPAEVNVLNEYCTTNDIQLIVYDKCNFCKGIPSNIYCRPLTNHGREGQTFIHFVIQHYNNLPNKIIFMPSNIYKHDRLDRLKNFVANNHVCDTNTLEGLEDFLLDFYEGKPMKIADTRPFKAWYDKYIGTWLSNDNGPCWNGLMVTSRERILRHPKRFYINVIDQINHTDSMEAVHFVERSMMSIF